MHSLWFVLQVVLSACLAKVGCGVSRACLSNMYNFETNDVTMTRKNAVLFACRRWGTDCEGWTI